MVIMSVSVFALSNPSDLDLFHEFDDDLTDSAGGDDLVEVGAITTGILTYNEEGSAPIHLISGSGGNVGLTKDVSGLIPDGDWELAFAFEVDNPVDGANQILFTLSDGPLLEDGASLVSFEPRGDDGNLEVNIKDPADPEEGDSLTLDAGEIIEDVVHFVRLKFTAATNTFDFYYDDMSMAIDSGSFAGDVDYSSIDELLVIVGGQSLGGPIALDGSIGNIGIYNSIQTDDYFEDTYNGGDILPLEVRLNDLENFTITGVDLGGTTDNTQPEFTFDLSSENTDLQLNYAFQIATDSEFTDIVVDYESGLVDQGEITFTVGQEAGDGEYDEAGEVDQELADGSYYMRSIVFLDDLTTDIVAFNGGEVVLVVDTSEPEEEEEEEETTTIISGSYSKRVAVNSNNKSLPSNYEEEVDRVLDEKVVTENPTNETNKCEALTMMARVFDWMYSDELESDFVDVPEWCDAIAAFALERGVVEGRADNLLGLETPVSRDEIAMMLFRELVEQGFDFEGDAEVSFTDVLTEWAKEAILALAKEGIVKGYEDGSFGGTNTILKQDLGVMLLRVRDRL